VILLAIALVALSALSPVHLPVSTHNAQAQAAIDRGLFFYYAYNREDAVRAFSQAASNDSQLAMAYWGVALAEGPDLNTPETEDRFEAGARASRQAVALENSLAPHERGFIESMALRYRGSFVDWNRDDDAYRAALLAFAESSQDQNAQLLAAEALLEHGGLSWQNGAPASGESREALAIVSSVLRADPANVMANHLCIHLYDLAAERTPARACARRLDAEVFPPAAEHLAHMPAHYWIETGDYAAALRSSERAYALMAQLSAADANSQHVEQYEKHDVAVGYSAAMMLGDFALAERWSQRMSSAFGTSFDAITALRFGRYGAAYDAAGTQFGGAAVRGLAAVHLDRLGEAQALAAHLASSSNPPGYVQQLFLARAAEAEGKYDEAIRWTKKALQNQQDQFGGELIPLIPAGELLGGIELRHGDAAGAVAAFSADLALYPDDSRALFGLSQAFAATGAQAQAAAARARSQQVWEGADTSLDDALP